MTGIPALETPRPAPPAPPGTGRRVVFIDLARALAAFFMLYGHVIDALLAPEYRIGRWHDAWLFQRGLTSCLFLLLSGFAFSIATGRHWAAQRTWSPGVARRVRRFATLMLLGYALHVPMSPIFGLGRATPEQWRNLLSVDVLQLIGATFLLIQALVMIVPSQRALTRLAFVLAALVPLVTPLVWAVDWQRYLPIALAAYLYPDTSSLFPLFPWIAYVLLGIGLGQIYAHWDPGRQGSYANAVLFLPGAVMVLTAIGLTNLPFPPFGSGPYAFIPPLVLLRAGACLLAVGVMAQISRTMAHLPHVFGAFAQETLVIYWVHVSLVYGSVWTPGLAWFYGRQLSPLQTLSVVVVLVAAMAWLALFWNRLKHARPAAARRVVMATFVLMAIRLMLPSW
ncbi:MAG: heparan-alpha-glucosaminide N-acetyltransferase domain-containing protein [Vicinamibacterales bacterium]